MLLLPGDIWSAVCWSWSWCLELRGYSLCSSLWNSSLWWWKHSQSLQENKGMISARNLFWGIFTYDFETSFFPQIALNPGINSSTYLLLGWHLYSSQPFVCRSKGSDSQDAYCWSYEADDHSWNSSASLVPSSSSSLLGCASTRYNAAS